MSLSKHSSGFFVADDCLLPFGLADSVAKKMLVSHINQPGRKFSSLLYFKLSSSRFRSWVQVSSENVWEDDDDDDNDDDIIIIIKERINCG